MRTYLLALMVLGSLAACGGDSGGAGGKDQCDGVTVVPPPDACMTTCDATPGAPTSCPGGFHCSEDGTCTAVCTQGGEECGDGYRCTPDGRCVGNDECIGLECQIVDCDGMGMPLTTISGTVYAPNGTLPLFGVNVYVPNQAVVAPPEGAICDRCGTSLPGFPLGLAITDDAGHFTLTGVPSGANVPIVIQTGKWRREVMLSNVNSCTDNALTVDQTRLPKNRSEGSIPKIAITTGGADALECLPRKLGIEDSELGKVGGQNRVDLYVGDGRNALAAGHPGGTGMLPSATPFWADVNQLKAYDIVFLSCEGEQNPMTKPQAALDAMKAYADLGGRVFASHWHNIWISGDNHNENGGNGQTPAVWSTIADWYAPGEDFNNDNQVTSTIDEAHNPKGTSFANWMVNVMGSTTRGQISINQPRATASSLDFAKAERWVTFSNPEDNNAETPQIFQFSTPNETVPEQRCGKVVFSDMHVSADSVSGGGGEQSYPNGCSTDPLTPQEKALAFMFFDIASCVGGAIL